MQLERDPTMKVKDMRDWLMSGQQSFNLDEVEDITLYQFIRRNMEKFNEEGTMDRQSGSGRPRTTRSKQNVVDLFHP